MKRFPTKNEKKIGKKREKKNTPKTRKKSKKKNWKNEIKKKHEKNRFVLTDFSQILFFAFFREIKLSTVKVRKTEFLAIFPQKIFFLIFSGNQNCQYSIVKLRKTETIFAFFRLFFAKSNLSKIKNTIVF